MTGLGNILILFLINKIIRQINLKQKKRFISLYKQIIKYVTVIRNGETENFFFKYEFHRIVNASVLIAKYKFKKDFTNCIQIQEGY